MDSEVKIKATLVREYTLRISGKLTPPVEDAIRDALCSADMDLAEPEEIPNAIEIEGVEVLAHDMDCGDLVSVEYEIEEAQDEAE